MAGQKSQKGANYIIMKRKIYKQLLDYYHCASCSRL